MASTSHRTRSAASMVVDDAPVEAGEDTATATLPSALALMDLWLNWPYACLALQRECQDAWMAHWGGGVPLDG